ncbi:hypothetical protein CHARACLAT_027467 [Characodon lateralis]|uniref:Uncharacterized protein n=1 Tax=Characodon lateralis TaxID=208331 RepID=A0ABU7E4B0_9TELE|nr:hypothetical protein [Characodon lateralis]
MLLASPCESKSPHPHLLYFDHLSILPHSYLKSAPHCSPPPHHPPLHHSLYYGSVADKQQAGSSTVVVAVVVCVLLLLLLVALIYFVSKKTTFCSKKDKKEASTGQVNNIVVEMKTEKANEEAGLLNKKVNTEQ